MADRNAQDLPGPRRAGERRLGLLDAQVDVFAAVLQAAIAEHRAGQQSRFEQDLKSVADAEHGPASLGKRAHRAHDGREARHRAGTKVVAVREAPGQDQDVGTLQVRILVPEVFRLLAEHVPRGVIRVLVAVAAGKDDYAKSHSYSTSIR